MLHSPFIPPRPPLLPEAVVRETQGTISPKSSKLFHDMKQQHEQATEITWRYLRDPKLMLYNENKTHETPFNTIQHVS